MGIQADLTDRTSLPAAFNAACEALGGGVDILVNNAGMQVRGKAEEIPLGDWDRLMELNVTALFQMSQLAAGRMLEQGYGKIINMASMLSFFGGLNCCPYTASKGAVAQLTKALSNEWAGRGVKMCIRDRYKEYGLTIPILGGHSVVDELTIHTPEIGAVIEGTYGTTTVAHDIGTEAFNTFNERHIEKVGYPASIMTLEPYLAISVALNALEKVGGDLADVEALRAALNETDLDTPTGKFHFDDYRQGLFTVYITQVTKAEDGSFYNLSLIHI